MKRAYQLTGLLGLAFSAFVANEALSLRLMTRLGPGPGFFPFWLAVVFGGLSALVLIGSSRLASAAATEAGMPPDDVGEAAPAHGWLRVLALVGSVAGVGLLMESVGYCLAMLAFSITALLLMGERRWPVLLGTALVLSFGVYFVFVRYLGVVLPSGLLSI